jgi:breast cancer 2 susceptibility protein
MKQLESRFEREVQGSTRSAIRKIVERDAACGRYLVLYVARVADGGKRIVLSDGWYCVSASIDAVMESAITRGKVGVGVKLAICNAVVFTLRV